MLLRLASFPSAMMGSWAYQYLIIGLWNLTYNRSVWEVGSRSDKHDGIGIATLVSTIPYDFRDSFDLHGSSHPLDISLSSNFIDWNHM